MACLLPVSYTHLDVYKRQVSALQNIRRNLNVNEFVGNKSAAITVDTDTINNKKLYNKNIY